VGIFNNISPNGSGLNEVCLDQLFKITNTLHRHISFKLLLWDVFLKIIIMEKEVIDGIVKMENKQTRLSELNSGIEELKFKIREAVARCNGVVFVVNAQKPGSDITPTELLNQVKSMGISVLKTDEEKSPLEEIDLRIDVQNVKLMVEEIDLRIDVQNVKLMVEELGKLQDEQYALMKEEFYS